MDLPNRRNSLAFSSMVIDSMSSLLGMDSVSAVRALTFPFSDVLAGLSGQFRDKWPCLLQVKQRPSLRCVSGSSLVELTRPLEPLLREYERDLSARVSIAFGSIAGNLTPRIGAHCLAKNPVFLPVFLPGASSLMSRMT